MFLHAIFLRNKLIFNSIRNNSSIVSGVTFLKAEARQRLRRCNSARVCVIIVVSGGKNWASLAEDDRLRPIVKLPTLPISRRVRPHNTGTN